MAHKEKKNQEFYDTNLAKWNEMANLHFAGGYDIEGFLAGKCSLQALEVEELGDVQGKKLLHLMCHIGLDTISWGKRGAEVTGVDFSEKAIEHARELAEKVGQKARFIAANVYEVPEKLDEQFDVVFMSYGVLCWLASIDKLTAIIERYLVPGGTFYIAEIHPLNQIFDDESNVQEFSVKYGYFSHGRPSEWQSEFSYASSTPLQNTKSYEWNYTLGDLVSGLASRGLCVEFLHEFPFLCYKGLPFLEQKEDGWWYAPADKPQVPLLFSLKAKKLG